jgi:hypothetical protein
VLHLLDEALEEFLRAEVRVQPVDRYVLRTRDIDGGHPAARRLPAQVDEAPREAVLPTDRGRSRGRDDGPGRGRARRRSS